MREKTIVDQFVHPVYQILRDFRDQDITHRAIRPTKFFRGGS